jgi:hypothetical protein
MFEFEQGWRAPQIKLPPGSRPDPEHNFHLSQFVYVSAQNNTFFTENSASNNYRVHRSI